MLSLAKLGLAMLAAVSGISIGMTATSAAYANEQCQQVCIKVAAWRCVDRRMECVATGQNVFETVPSSGDGKPSGANGQFGLHLHQR